MLGTQLCDPCWEKNRWGVFELEDKLADVTKERDGLAAKMAKVQKLVDIADAANDSQTDMEVALSASFQEGIYCVILEETEAKNAALEKRVEALVDERNKLREILTKAKLL